MWRGSWGLGGSWGVGGASSVVVGLFFFPLSQTVLWNVTVTPTQPENRQCANITLSYFLTRDEPPLRIPPSAVIIREMFLLLMYGSSPIWVHLYHQIGCGKAPTVGGPDAVEQSGTESWNRFKALVAERVFTLTHVARISFPLHGSSRWRCDR